MSERKGRNPVSPSPKTSTPQLVEIVIIKPVAKTKDYGPFKAIDVRKVQKSTARILLRRGVALASMSSKYPTEIKWRSQL